MSALITEILNPRAFEVVRDRIGSVLTIELLNQSVLQADPSLNPKIFLERTIPFSHEELPAINLMLSRGEYDNMTSIKKDGTYSFDIDVYEASKSKDNVRGDTAAILKVQRLLGLVHAILSHQKYITLQFARPFIEHVQVNDIKIADPQNVKDAANVMMGRLNYSVRVPETNVVINPETVALSFTKVKLNETEKGYFYVLEL